LYDRRLGRAHRNHKVDVEEINLEAKPSNPESTSEEVIPSGSYNDKLRSKFLDIADQKHPRNLRQRGTEARVLPLQPKTIQPQAKTPQSQTKTVQPHAKTVQQQAKTVQQQAKTVQQQAKTVQQQSTFPPKRVFGRPRKLQNQPPSLALTVPASPNPSSVWARDTPVPNTLMIDRPLTTAKRSLLPGQSASPPGKSAQQVFIVEKIIKHKITASGKVFIVSRC
jgi:hypothetical protein